MKELLIEIKNLHKKSKTIFLAYVAGIPQVLMLLAQEYPTMQTFLNGVVPSWVLSTLSIGAAIGLMLNRARDEVKKNKEA